MVCMKGVNPKKNFLWLQWTAGTGAMVLLFTLGLMIGWTSPYLAQLTAEDSPIPLTMSESSWVASLMNFGRFLGAIIGGFSVHFFGSKQTLVYIGFPLTTSFICIILADSVIWLYVARIAGGISFGMAFSSFPIFLGEVSSPAIRGSLVSLAMSGVNFGTLSGNIMGAYIPMSAFSYIGLVPNVFVIILFLWLPQSPHYLVRLGRMEDAETSIALYSPNVNSKTELESLKDFIATSGILTFKDRLREFNIPRNRKAGIIVFILFFFMQFSGLNTVILYMQIIFTDGKLTVIHPATAVIIVSAIGVVAGFLSVSIADKLRRKVLMIISSAGVSVSMIALGTHFALLNNGFDPNALQWLPLASVIVFELFVCNGVIAVPNMILSELFAPNIKDLVTCCASILLGLYSFAATKTYQPLVNIMGEAYMFWIHTLIMAMSVIFSAIFLPETKGKSLQEIQNALMKK